MASAIDTAKQENGSKVFFEGFIEGKKKDVGQFLNEVAKVYPEIAKDPKIRNKWLPTYEKQALALKKYLGSKSGYIYSRDERGGFMPFIEDIAKSKGGVKTKDNWNPADIYMVKKTSERSIRKKISEITNTSDEKANIISLNIYMKELLESKELLPISLKAVTESKKTASLELANMGKIQLKAAQFTQDGPLKCFSNYGTNSKTPTEIDNGEISGTIITGGSPAGKVNWQTRNFVLSSSMGGVQTDLTPTGGESGAKLGKTSAEAIDKFLSDNFSKIQVNRPLGPSKDPFIPNVGGFTDKEKKYWVKFQKGLSKFKINGEPIDFGEMKVQVNSKIISTGDFENVLEYAINNEQSSRYAAGRLRSKLTCLRWAFIWAKIDFAGLLSEWLKVLYYGAKKEFKEENGPFIKIY